MRFRSLLAAVAFAALAAACNEGQIATELPGGASGGAVLLGTVVNSGRATSQGITVSAVGTSSVTDADGRFALSGLPEGAVTLRLKGADCDASVRVSGLVNGRAVTVQVRVAGSQASVVG